MPLMQAVTNAIANPKQVRLSQERASARAFSGLEPRMREIRDISPESVQGVSDIAVHRTISSLSSRPPSELSSRTLSGGSSRDQSPDSAPSSRPTAQLQRSHSDVPLNPLVVRSKQEFTPCITAMDLTNDQIKRNYSSDDLLRWDRSRNPLPPLATMRGYGRYRTAESADPFWRMQHFKKQIKEIECLESMTAGLDMEEMTGITNEEWQALTCARTRRTSTVSSQSTKTDSTTGPPESSTRISRGFSPSGSSTKSSHSGFAHGRKSSSLSTMNFASEVDSHTLAVPLKRASTLLSERRASGPLSTIVELQSNATTNAETKRKYHKPCEFSDTGDPESAVASDVEDEDSWTDVVGTNPPRESGIAKALKEGKISDPQPQLGLTRVRTRSSDQKHPKGVLVTLDRSKTIRAARPEARRRRSKTKSNHERDRSETEVNAKSKTSNNVADSTDQSSAYLEMHKPRMVEELVKHTSTDDTPVPDQHEEPTEPENVKKFTQDWHPTRNRSTTAVFRENPAIHPVG